MKAKNWLIGILGALSIWSCDTASSIDPPENSFFVKFYGANGNQEGVDAVLNVDGTITLFGTTEVGGIKQLYFVNIEQNGNVVWESTIATPTEATAKDIILTNDGRYAIAADVRDASGTNDVLIMTLTLGGVEIARDTVSFKANGLDTNETASTITQTTDGFIVSGTTTNTELDPELGDIQDAMHLRFSDNLIEFDPTWAQTSGQGNIDMAVKLIQVSQAITESIIFGSTDVNGSLNFYYEGLGYFGESTSGITIDVASSSEILTKVISAPIQSGDGFLLVGVSKTSSSTDIFITKLRKDLKFDLNVDLQYQKTLSVNLGTTSIDHVAAFAPSTSGFLLLANDKSSGVQNFYLNKIDNGGSVVWPNPIIFGGEHDDEIGAVLELPDGSIGIIGTFAVGQDGEKKMTFIKVNKEGKFSK